MIGLMETVSLNLNKESSLVVWFFKILEPKLKYGGQADRNDNRPKRSGGL